MITLDSDAVYGATITIGPSDDPEFAARIEVLRNPQRDDMPEEVIDSYSITHEQTRTVARLLLSLAK